MDKGEAKMTLKKNAVIHGGGFRVAIGRLGERACLTGHHLVPVGRGPKDIPATGGAVAEVEAHDGQVKEAHA
jgi:hypothetical protein